MVPHALTEVVDSTGYTPSVANLHKLRLSFAQPSSSSTDITFQRWKLSFEHVKEIRCAVQEFRGVPCYHGSL